MSCSALQSNKFVNNHRYILRYDPIKLLKNSKNLILNLYGTVAVSFDNISNKLDVGVVYMIEDNYSS